MTDAGAGPATVVGRVLGGVFFLVGKARGGRRKALHPRGVVRPALIRRHGGQTQAGVVWLDQPGIDHVLVRLSRSAGLPDVLPDVLGLAFRVPADDDRYGDLLLASAWTRSLARFVLRLSRRFDGVSYCSLFPYRTPSGPLLLAAIPVAGASGTFALAWSRLTGPWNRFATLALAPIEPGGRNEELSLDPVLNVVPGLEPYRWAAEIRRYAYAASRRARGAWQA